MKNRAKCKLCLSIIESFHPGDYIACKCDEISVSGGLDMLCAAKNWCNFIRVDDLGNEIAVKADSDVKPLYNESVKPTREELLKMLDEMVERIESLPSSAMTAPVTHYDLASSLMLLSSILRS
jgi:hypothetical protein